MAESEEGVVTEEEARGWVAERWGTTAVERLSYIVSAIIAENQHQNLISPGSIAAIWSRHIVDSAQLVPLVTSLGTWADIGTGGGFPGLVVAALRYKRTVLIEPRRLRADFLTKVARDLRLEHVEVVQAKADSLSLQADIVSARAVAPLDTLFSMVARLNRRGECLFLRGQSGRDELAAAQQEWRGVFHVEQSITNNASIIVRASRLERR